MATQTKQRLLGTGEASKLSGAQIGTIKKWCVVGIVSPVVDGQGKGTRRAFSTLQILGLTYAQLFSRIGATGELLKSIVDFFALRSPEKLAKELDAGNKFLLIDPSGRVKLVAAQAQERELSTLSVNVANQYRKLLEDIAAIEKA